MRFYKTCPKCHHRTLTWESGYQLKEVTEKKSTYIKSFDIPVWWGICSFCDNLITLEKDE